MFPSCKCVLASTRGGGLKLKTACKHWIHNLMLGGLDVRKFSARPSNERYHASCDEAISYTKHNTLKNNTFQPISNAKNGYILNLLSIHFKLRDGVYSRQRNNNKLQKGISVWALRNQIVSFDHKLNTTSCNHVSFESCGVLVVIWFCIAGVWFFLSF